MSFVALRDKRSVSFPPELSRRIAEDAARYDMTFSGWLADTAARRLKLDAGRRALTAWERENGPLSPRERAEGLARARASLRRPVRRTKRSA